MDFASIVLGVLGAYFAAGFLFSVPFVTAGVQRIDPHAARGSWGFRLLIIPGTMFLWPLLARRWLKGVQEPPEERSPHRCAARHSCNSRHEKTPAPAPASARLSRAPLPPGVEREKEASP